MADYTRIPKLTMESLRAWVKYGALPGSFLQAVIRNELNQAVARADRDNLAAIADICAWMRNEAPIGCWGSREMVERWEQRKRAEWQARTEMTA